MNAPPSDIKRPLRSKSRRRLLICAALLTTYTLVGFFAVPAVIKSQLLKRLPELTHRQASVGEVRVNPFALSLAIRDLSLTETNGDRFAAFSEFRVNLQLSSLFRRAWVLKELTVRGPFFQAVKEPSGEMNFDDIVIELPELPKVVIGTLNVETGAVRFVDLSLPTPFRNELSPISLRMTDFTTLRGRNHPYTIQAESEGGAHFTWAGDLSVNPLRSSGRFTLQDLPLPKGQPYLQEFLHVEVLDGRLNVEGTYQLSTSTNVLDAEIKDLALSLTNFSLKSLVDGDQALQLPAFTLKQVAGNLRARTLSVGQATVSGGSVLFRRNQDESLNWLAVLKPPVAPGTNNLPVTGTSRIARPWQMRLDEFRVADFAVTTEDRVPARPASFKLNQLNLVLRGVSNQSNAPVTAELSLQPNVGGRISVRAQGTLLPATAQANVTVTNLDVRPAQPYVGESLNLVVNSGFLSGQHEVQFNMPGLPLVSAKGNVGIRKFSATDTISFTDTIKWEKHHVDGVEFSWQPNRLHVENIHFDGLQSSVVITTNGLINVASLIKTKPAGSPTPLSDHSSAPPIEVTLGSVTITNTRLAAADRSIQPHFATAIEDFSGTITGISLQGTQVADVSLSGRLNPGSQFNVAGRVRPVATNLLLALAVDCNNADLTPITPYFEKFAGYPLLKGQLLVNTAFELDGRRLQSTNVVRLDQLTLGVRNQSPDAIKLPVKLGVALLKDRNGIIKFDLPVSGSLDDPQFRIGKIVWQIVENLLVKAATAPFALLGSMFGGGPEMQFVDFQPGSAEIPTNQLAKLETLIKALHERPALSLEISASIADSEDRPALSRALLERRLKSLRVQELTAQGVTPPSLEEVALDPADSERLLRALYQEHFPLEISSSNAPPALETGLPLPLGSSATTNQPPAARQVVAAPTPSRGAIAEKGALRTRQMATRRPVASGTTPSAPTPTAPATTVPIADTTVSSPASMTREFMEQQLIGKLAASEDDLRGLAQARARAVLEFLVRSQQVEADRLLVTTAQLGATGAAARPRVTFSLN